MFLKDGLSGMKSIWIKKGGIKPPSFFPKKITHKTIL